MARMIPPVGTRFLFADKRASARRVWELVETLTLEGVMADVRHPDRLGCDRHTIRLVEEVGHTPASIYGVGREIHVEDAWFDRPDFVCVPKAVA